MIRRDAFVHYVKDALANLYDPIHLQKHPLAGLLQPVAEPGQTAGEALRNLLWQTIESLRPPETIPIGRSEWLSYRLLWLYYVQSVTQTATCQELGLSQRSFYRRLQEALEAVADVLWVRYQEIDATLHEEPVRTPGIDELATEQAVRLAQESRRQPVDLGHAINAAREIAEPLLRQQGISLLVEVPSTLPTVLADPAILNQIIVNVLSEAIDLAIGDTLRLTVALQRDEVLCRLDRLDAGGLTAGRGEERSGFRVSHDLLQVYGGQLWFQRDEGNALALFLKMPVAKPVSVLVVDDSAETIELYSRYLQTHHYIVRVARDEKQLAASFLPTPPDIILLDVLMPQTDGWSILQRLKTLPETRNIPVVICSVLDQPRLALALGAAVVLRKPVSETTLLGTVQLLLSHANSLG